MTEKLKLPTSVIESDWKDDIDENEDGNISLDNIEYEPYKNENQYISPKNVPEKTIEEIKAKNLKRGQNILRIFSVNKKAA